MIYRAKETVEAHFVEILWEHMLEKATHEFQGRQSHGLPSTLTGIFAPEGDSVIIGRENPVVGDGDPMDIAGQITEDFLAALYSRFRVNNPSVCPD